MCVCHGVEKWGRTERRYNLNRGFSKVSKCHYNSNRDSNKVSITNSTRIAVGSQFACIAWVGFLIHCEEGGGGSPFHVTEAQ